MLRCLSSHKVKDFLIYIVVQNSRAVLSAYLGLWVLESLRHLCLFCLAMSAFLCVFLPILTA